MSDAGDVARIARLAQLYATLSRCTDAVMRCHSLDELAHHICDDAVTYGGFLMAWVGMADEQSRRLRPIASAGAGTDYLKDIEIAIDDVPAGRGPTGTAFRVNQAQWCDDFQRDPGTAPWHERGARFGWTSSASLPIACHGRPVGALTLYVGADCVPFDDESRALLLQMAAQMSYACDAYTREEAQRKADAGLRLQAAALNAAADGIIITDAEGAVTWVNDAAARLAGYRRDEMLGHPVELLIPDELPRGVQETWASIRAGRPWTGEFTLRRKDGSVYTAEATTTPVRDDAGIITHYISVGRDITKEKELQAQLLYSQKMEVVGRLAGSIAHDFNNLLGVINGTADLAAMSLERGHPVRADLETIRQTGERAAALTRQLLAFSRKQVLAPQVLDLNRVIGDLASLMQRLVGETISVIVRPLARQPLIVGDAGQMEQVVLNLVVNARDAMPGGGTITIMTRDAGTDVTLSVADTGTGIDPAIRSRIFEPFFTTKDAPRGTGLGLSTVLGIVEANGGRIDVESRAGFGATFTVTWPRCDALSGTEPGSPVQAPAAVTVMVVEDDAPLRDLTERILRDAGYVVRSAESAEDALARIEADDTIDVLLADVVLPGMSGVQLADRMTVVRPSLKVLYMSGYADEGLGAVERKAVEGQLLRKPFTAAQVVAVVRTALGGPGLPAPEPKRRG
jgi:PAS domain S-box-containing protein